MEAAAEAEEDGGSITITVAVPEGVQAGDTLTIETELGEIEVA